ncbi:MAG: Endoribonuclease EndoA [bacterium]|nr:Endoribonuclease EndoA [bacterium]
MEVHEGDIFLANMDPTIGVEMKKTRPVVIVSNDWINQFSQLVVVVPVTTSTQKVSPSHVLIPAGQGGLNHLSKALTEQIRAMDKLRLVRRIGKLEKEYMAKLHEAMRNTLNMD